ncbi:tripartite tricarboxylate transporter TctB family protein [Caballeronia sordidicola]|uniref:tripartite tricarboxylate transporter TctB family protein n=1 Tax=Caballeronia sordidicola TaxID=196367 RepID=UPI000B774C35|nr:tripartite tricarboxylate transporter TctB family protein [Caballeronia sordidicola]
MIVFRKIPQDYYAGILMIVIGGATMMQAQTYQIGTLDDMGPGYFPFAIGALMAITGITIALGARHPAKDLIAEKSFVFEWRGLICICLSIVAFVVLGHFGGLLPATFAIVFLSALGDRENTWKSALILAALMCCVCFVVFSLLLRVQLPLFQWSIR